MMTQICPTCKTPAIEFNGAWYCEKCHKFIAYPIPPYKPPAIVYEAALEVRAGSPLAILPQSTQVPDPIRPWGD